MTQRMIQRLSFTRSRKIGHTDLTLSRWCLMILILSSSCEQRSASLDSVSTTHTDVGSGTSHLDNVSTSRELEFLLGRVTSISVHRDSLSLGHENGVISLWGAMSPLLNPARVSLERSLTPKPTASWVAHEGAVRTLRRLDERKDERGQLESLGAGGSWVRWSHNGRVIKRERASSVYANRVISDGLGGWVVAGARGVVARWRGGERLWSSAGEHGRAAFDVQLLDASRALTVGSDGWVRCWQIDDGSSCGALPLHQGWAIALRRLKRAQPSVNKPGHWWVSAGSDGVIKVWASKALERSLKSSLERPSAAPLQGRRDQAPLRPHASVSAHARNITSLVCREGLILSGSEDGSVSLSEFTASEELKTRWRAASQALKPVLSVALDLERQRALIGGGRAQILWSAPLSLVPQSKVELRPLL